MRKTPNAFFFFFFCSSDLDQIKEVVHFFSFIMSISEIDSVDFLFEDIRCRYDKRARPLLDSQEVGPGHSKVKQKKLIIKH